MRMVTVNDRANNKTTITLEYTPVDFERLPHLPAFLRDLQAGWELMMDTRTGTYAPDSALDDNLPKCSYDPCDYALTNTDLELGEDRCESHRVDQWGVMEMDCACWQSSADNADIYVCADHTRAMAARGEGPLPSSFSTT